jgi:Cys-rich protein (TIGR01571 family)
MCTIFDRIFSSSWITRWTPDEALKENFPPRHSDFRDTAPPEMASVYAAHQSLIQEGKWTFGLFECWCPKVKMVKHSTHLPCWDSFKINPCKWRGIVFGRTLEECYWDGLRQTRWARTVYAANLSSEYVLPVRGVGRHGYKSEIKALCWMYFLMGCIFSCGIGQVFSLCGNFCFNFSAFYSCHAREKIRRRYNLPPAFGLPPGIDDFVAHFFCLYCSVYQEMRELTCRGVDGPGLHILDVLPGSYAAAPGGLEAISTRKAAVDEMLSKGAPKMFVSRPKTGKKLGSVHQEESEAPNVSFKDLKYGTAMAVQRMKGALFGRDDSDEGTSYDSSDDVEFGWASHCTVIPCVQEMTRDLPRTQSLPTLAQNCEIEGVDGEGGVKGQLNECERNDTLERAWSVAY